MIYLIDEKISRQLDYGWSNERFEQYNNEIIPIYSYEEMSNYNFRKEKLFSGENILLIHESFFNNPLNESVKKKFEQIRFNIYEYARENPNALIVFFSGSIATRKNDKNVFYLPVSVFYQNLEIFVIKIKINCIDIKYLLFGKNPKIEDELINKQQEANNEIDDLARSDSDKSNFFIRTAKNFIQKPLTHCNEQTIFNKVKDSDLIINIQKWFLEKKYDNIFIPLCFGSTLSDFNGLRLATLIRCTNTPNQLANIFIYSFADVEMFINNDYFNILKTKNVKLVKYKKKDFKEAVELELEPLTIDELPKEISKLKLDVPKNFDDNHSVANEWGVYQLAYNAGIDIYKITDFDKKKLDTLYFKWLIAKNGLYEDLSEEENKKNEIFRTEIKKIGIKPLGKIDLSKIPKK